jgi:hypothetical protein
MERHGFRNYPLDGGHYTLQIEASTDQPRTTCP